MSDSLKIYVAYAVDGGGIARATYEFSCLDDEEARRRAQAYLSIHDIMELWHGPRRVARLRRADEL